MRSRRLIENRFSPMIYAKNWVIPTKNQIPTMNFLENPIHGPMILYGRITISDLKTIVAFNQKLVFAKMMCVKKLSQTWISTWKLVQITDFLLINSVQLNGGFLNATNLYFLPQRFGFWVIKNNERHRCRINLSDVSSFCLFLTIGTFLLPFLNPFHDAWSPKKMSTTGKNDNLMLSVRGHALAANYACTAFVGHCIVQIRLGCWRRERGPWFLYCRLVVRHFINRRHFPFINSICGIVPATSHTRILT